MKNLLSDEQRSQLRLQHKKERDKRVCDRIKAVLLSDEGWSNQQIAHVLLLSDEAIRQHILDYQIEHKLKPENGGSIERLSDQQSKLLENHLHEHTYLYIKDIITYVKSIYGVDYTVSGMTHWLKRHFFSYKKPALVPGKANDNARYYKNKAVQKHLERSKIILHFLPPYSPNLNPIERLWKWMKERVMYNTYYECFEDFKSAIIGFLESVSSLDPACVLGQAFASRVRDKFRPIGKNNRI